MSWNTLCTKKELQLLGTLNGGQSFRWKYDDNSKEWIGVFMQTVWKLRENNNVIEYKVTGSLLPKSRYKNSKNGKFDKENDKSIYGKIVKDYFRLDFNLKDYYKTWSETDNLFKSACTQFYGIRMLDQEPVENLFSFICSQNNHISRISGMVEKLCKHYGESICEDDGITYYSFPKVEILQHPQVLPEKNINRLAKFIQKSAAQIVEWGGDEWFISLKDMKYKDARLELMKLFGIGPKVADCICLMSLNHLEAVPVDTHVYQIAVQNYVPHLGGKKNVNDKMYAEIGGHFRELFGDFAGWAHTVLFCADLKKFQQDQESDNGGKPAKRKRKK